MDTSTDHSYHPWAPKPKRRRRSFFKIFFWFLFTLCVGLGALAFIAYKNIPSTANINDCFITSMYQVELCPTSPSYVKFNQLPKHLVAALIAAEDASFYFHKGFDWDEIKDSFEKSMDAGRWVRGGSTLTQQLAKNLYLSKEKSLLRKMKEFFVSQELEKALTKPQIIEKYFNVVEFGPEIFGITKAAQHYFRKSPGALSPAESAYLVSLLPSPVKYSSAFRARKELSNFNKRRVSRILSLLLLQHKISEEEYNYELRRAEYSLWAVPPDESMIFTGDTEPSQALPTTEDEIQKADQALEEMAPPEPTPPEESVESPAIEEDL